MGFSRFLGRKARRPLVFAAVLMFLGAAGAVLAAPSVTTFAQTTPGIVETPEVAVTLVFSENVTNVDSTDFAVLDGTFTPVGAGGPAVSAVSGSGRDYSVTFDSNGQTGFFFLQVDASNDIVSSPGGEALEPTGLSVFVRFAGERPYVTAFDTGGGTSNFPEFALSFSRDVTNVDPTDFLVFSAAKAGPGEPFVTTVTGGPRDYRVTVDANSSSGTYQVFIEPTNDIVSSPGGLALVFGGETDIFVLSPGPPTAFLLDFSTPRSALPTTVNVEYDEPVFNLTLDELQLVRGATPVTITGGDVVPSDGRRFRFDNLTYASVGEGPHTFSLVPGDVVDGDGNPPSNTSTFDFVIDSTPPSIVSAQLVTASPTTNDFVEVELEWNEPVVDFLFDNQVEKVTTGTAAASVNSIDPVSGSDTRYRITLQASGDGTISVGAVPGATEDLAGNTSATGVFSAPVAVDNTRPFLETFAAAANPTNADPVIYTFGWNETVAGFDAGDITVTPSAGITFTGTEFAQAAAKNTEDCTEHVTAGGVETGANAPEWDETSTNFGTPICDTGLCGTDNPLNGLFWLWFGGTTSPEVSSLSQDVSFPPGTATLSYELIVESVSEATPAQLTVSLGGTILHTETPLVGTIIDTRREIDVSAFADSTTRTLSFDFDNNSSTVITNFFLDDISIQSCPPAESGGSTFTLTINGVQGEFGTLTVDVAGFSVTDAVSQGNLADSDITVIDRQPPGISQILAINSSPTFDDTLAWDVTFAEPVTGFTKEDLLVSAGAATFGDSAVTQLSDFRYSVQLFDVAGGGDVTFTIPADTVQDAAGNGNSVPFTSPVITHILPEITVGSLNLNVSFPSTNGQFTDLGGGNYDIGSGVLINDMVQCNSAIQVRGNTITGNGTIRQFAGQILHDGAYSIDATTGDATITDPVEDKFVWNAVFLGICHFRINANSITLDGWMRHTGLADNGFKGATLSSNHVLTMPGFFLGPDPCDDTGALQFTISSVQLETNQNRFIGVQPVVTGTPFSSISFDQFAVRVGNELTASGSIVKQGHTLPFDSVTANADGMSFNVAYGSPESEGIIATYDNVQITRTGQFNVSGGTLTTEQGGFSGTFSPPVFNGTPQVRTDVTVNTTTAFGTVVLRDIDFDGRPGPDRIAGGPDASVEINGVPFSLPDGGKFFRFAGFSASSATILSLDGIGVNFSSLSVNNDSVAIGGGGYEVLGLSYSFDVTEPEGGNGVSVQGGFGLPDNLGAASGLQLAAAVTILDTPQGPDVQLNGLQFCTPAGPDIKIKKSNFKLPQLCFEYDEGPPEVIAGDVTVGIPEVVDLTAGFGVKGGKLDKISLGVDGLNLAIDSTGAFLQSISGGVENLSRVETTWDEKYFLFLPGAPPLERTERMTGVPPIRVTGTIGASAGPQVLGQALISATVAAMIDETQFRLDGTVTIVIIDVGGGYVHMRWSGPLQGVNVGGHMTYLLVIRGQVDASLDFNGNFRGCASITIRIPDGVPFGGLEFGGVFVCVSAPPFSIRGCVTIIVDLCLTISEDGSISFGKEDSVEPWEVPFWQPIPMDSIDKTTGEPQTVYMYMFSNWVGGEKHYRKDGGFKSSRSGSETRSITLP
ncbi:MAG: large repetitive protein, partial [Candidatus Sumerlaeota bacterium]|nr:large repetitive protein [Candidatus Sumerlaeota bacterium]